LKINKQDGGYMMNPLILVTVILGLTLACLIAFGFVSPAIKEVISLLITLKG
jgi:hypothetical protein